MTVKLEKINLRNYAVYFAMLEIYKQKCSDLDVEIRQKERVARLMSKIDLRYQGVNFSDFTVNNAQQKKIKEIVESYVATFQKSLNQAANLIFMGKSGTGKTFLSFILHQTLIKSGWMSEYNANTNFLKRLREKQVKSYAEFENTLTFYKHLPFLILDEITEGCGAGETLADWEKTILRLIIDKRYSAKKCTLIITNRSKEELIDRLGVPIVSRLTENGITLAFNWDSFRKI